MSPNQTLLMQLAQGCSDYFRAIHQATHFGSSDYSLSHDEVFDKVQTKRLNPDENSQILFGPVGCYADPDVICEDLNPDRLYGITPPYFGLSKLVYRWVNSVGRLARLDASSYTNSTPELRYISSAYRYDMREGINGMTTKIMDTGVAKINKAIKTTILTAVVLMIAILFSLVAFAMPWRSVASDVRAASAKLLDLLPMDENEKEMQLLPSMRTGVEYMDAGREKIIDACLQLLEVIRRKQSVSTLVDSHKSVMHAVMKVFTAEEADMEQRNYPGKKDHVEFHLLLRQRLTVLGDMLRLNDAATAATVRHVLVSLFDSHFTDSDVHFAETLPTSERTFKMDGSSGD
jgi:hemerythrin